MKRLISQDLRLGELPWRLHLEGRHSTHPHHPVDYLPLPKPKPTLFYLTLHLELSPRPLSCIPFVSSQSLHPAGSSKSPWRRINRQSLSQQSLVVHSINQRPVTCTATPCVHHYPSRTALDFRYFARRRLTHRATAARLAAPCIPYLNPSRANNPICQSRSWSHTHLNSSDQLPPVPSRNPPIWKLSN